MGIPYSRQINAAFDQVTPLVAAGFRVLETTRNISVLLALIQVLTVILLALVLLALLALLVSVNPHLERERDAVVTPAVRWLCGAAKEIAWMGAVVVVGISAGGAAGVVYTRRMEKEAADEAERAAREVEGDGGGDAQGK